MKRVVTVAGAVALLASAAFAGNAVAAKGGASRAKLRTVAVCTSTPFGVAALRDLSQGIRNGTNIAIHKLAPMMAKVGLKVKQINYDYASTTDPSNYDANRAGLNAQACIGQGNALGLIGTLNSGAALVAEPIANNGHLVMISPANTNPTLTAPAQRASQEPATHSGALKYVSYYRTVTTDKLQGPAGAQYAHNKLGAHSYCLINDGLQYGVGLATFFEQEANALHMTKSCSGQIDTSNTATSSNTLASLIEGHNPDIVYCGCDSETSNLLAYDLRTGGYSKPFVAGDAITANNAWLNSTTSATPGAGVGAANTQGTSVGPANAKGFFKTLYNKYDKAFYKSKGIQPYDATSYDATGSLLTAIYKAAKAHKLKGSIMAQRTAVVNAMHSVTFNGATGKSSFDSNGDTKNKILSIYKVVNKSGTLNWTFVEQFSATGSPV